MPSFYHLIRARNGCEGDERGGVGVWRNVPASDHCRQKSSVQREVGSFFPIGRFRAQTLLNVYCMSGTVGREGRRREGGKTETPGETSCETS